MEGSTRAFRNTRGVSKLEGCNCILLQFNNSMQVNCQKQEREHKVSISNISLTGEPIEHLMHVTTVLLML